MPPATTTDVSHWRWTFVLTFLIVTVLTHLPRTEGLDPVHVPPDKLIHFAAFGVIALLLVRSRWMPWPVAIVLLMAWLPFDEWTQGLVSPSREFEWADIISGWLGVASIGVFCDALRPPSSTRGHSGWTRMNATFDEITATPSGGLLPAVTGATVFLAVLISTYVIIWMAMRRSESNVAMLLALGAGGGAAWGMIRSQWRGAGGPALGSLAWGWWIGALALLLGGTALLRSLVGAESLDGLGAPIGLFAAIVLVARAGRGPFLKACEEARGQHDA